MNTVDKVNNLSKSDFISIFGNVFEKTSWIAEKTYELKPFLNFKALQKCFLSVYDKCNDKQYLEILKLKKKIIHIHLKDKNFFGQNVVIGTGNVNFTSIFRSLKKINYKGNFVFESNRGGDPIITMKNNLKFIKKVATNAGYKI